MNAPAPGFYAAAPLGGAVKLYRVRADGGVELVAGNRRSAITAPAARQAVLDAIACNPATAQEAFAQATGQCATCGRHLTDARSLAAGVGPVCRRHQPRFLGGPALGTLERWFRAGIGASEKGI